MCEKNVRAVALRNKTKSKRLKMSTIRSEHLNSCCPMNVMSFDFKETYRMFMENRVAARTKIICNIKS